MIEEYPGDSLRTERIAIACMFLAVIGLGIIAGGFLGWLSL